MSTRHRIGDASIAPITGARRLLRNGSGRGAVRGGPLHRLAMEPDTTYTFRVRGIDAAGTGPKSAPSNPVSP